MTLWISAALDEHHDVGAFESGRDVLDRWLRESAMRAQRAGSAHTTVWTAPDSTPVIAFYAIAPTQFASSELPARSLSTGYSIVPGYLLPRLALDRSLHGQGLGTQLLLDALERVVDAATHAGGRLIAVDALDASARRFYEHHGFQPIENSNRLVMKVATARSALHR